MTVEGFLSFAADMRGLSGDAKKRALGRVIDRCFLASVIRQSIETLSKGYRHRTCLAQALIHDPEVLILDEPTDGLDPNQKHEVRNLIRELGATKVIVFSTHILEEVDAACTRAIIIDRGKIVANGTPAALRAMSELAGAVTLHASGTDTETVARRLGTLEGVARVERVEAADGALRAYPHDKSAAGALAGAVVELAGREGWRLDLVRTEEGQLDEVFRRITLPDTVKALSQ
jgi:ABC-2 type transport system ATP-binding protein